MPSLWLKGTAVLPRTVSLSGLLPFWLGSPCSAPFLSGTAASPGTRGLSTYLGFLTGPAVGMSWVYLIFSRWTTSFLCTQSTLHNPKQRRGIISYTRSCYHKEQGAAALPLLWERNTLWAFWNAKPAGKQNQSACCDKPEKASCASKASDFFTFQLGRLSKGLLSAEHLFFHYNNQHLWAMVLMEAVNTYNVHKNQNDFTRALKFTVFQSLRLIE